MRTTLRGNQDGLVAITTTLVIMIIITLVITSFTLVVRREQRQSLDRQLSTQAFYAAETGIQDAINAIKQGAINSDITDCDGYQTALGNASPSIDYNNSVSSSSGIQNVSYSCVLIDVDPGELKYDVLNPNTGTYIMAIHSNTGNISSLRFSWQNTVDAVGGTDQFEAPGSTTFPKDPGTLKTGLPRVTVMPGSFNQDSIADQTRTFFMYPSEGGSGTASLSDSSGGIVSGNCSTSHPDDPYNCNVEVTTDGTSNTYFVAIKALYKPIAFQINAYDSVANNLHIEGAQAIVDVTGKAEDVLRRVQVRVPYESDIVPSKLGEMLPLTGIEATNTICKQFKVTDAQYEDLCTAGNLITPTDMTPT